MALGHTVSVGRKGLLVFLKLSQSYNELAIEYVHTHMHTNMHSYIRTSDENTKS